MFKNLFKTAYRNLYKHKFFTLLNIIGLALGMSLGLLYVAMLAFLFRFDDFHPQGDRIYRVTTQLHDNKENPQYASAPVSLAQALKKQVAGVEKVVRIHSSLGGEAIYQQTKLPLSGYFADPEFLDVFNFPLLQGNKATALTQPNALVITQKEALRLFGRKEAMGLTINMVPYGELMVTGILQELPDNSHLQFGAIASYATLLAHQGASLPEQKEGWSSFANSYIYLLLAENYQPAHVERSLQQTAKQRYTRPGIFSPCC